MIIKLKNKLHLVVIHFQNKILLYSFYISFIPEVLKLFWRITDQSCATNDKIELFKIAIHL